MLSHPDLAFFPCCHCLMTSEKNIATWVWDPSVKNVTHYTCNTHCVKNTRVFAADLHWHVYIRLYNIMQWLDSGLLTKICNITDCWVLTALTAWGTNPKSVFDEPGIKPNCHTLLSVMSLIWEDGPHKFVDHHKWALSYKRLRTSALEH